MKATFIKKLDNCIVEPYNSSWPNAFEAEAIIIKQVLGDQCIEVHHIGSTSIKGLAAKPIIDIIVIVQDISIIDGYNDAMKRIGFEAKGECGIPFRRYFTKGHFKRTHHLHVYEQGNSEIELNHLFRDYLRNDLKALQEYANLKINLASNADNFKKPEGSLLPYYTLAKDAFIRSSLDKAGFKSLRIAITCHFHEWEEFHRIRKEQLFDPINVVYDPNYPDLKKDNRIHFVLYKGTKIVTIAHVEVMKEKVAALRSLATDEPYKNNGYGKTMLMFIEKWLKSQGINIVKMHVAMRAEIFYRKLGYDNMHFDDESVSSKVVDLGKVL